MKIGVLGGAGRMGRLVIQKVLENPEAQLSAVGIHYQKCTGLDLPDIPITTYIQKVFSHSDIVIDFTKPEALQDHLESAMELKKPMVIGTTGLIDAHRCLIKEAGKHIPIVYAPNMSLGLALMTKLTEQMAAILDTSFDIEVLEMHHRYKTDAPSGTALALGNAAAKGRNIPFSGNACFDRTHRSSPRFKDEIGFAVLRGGNIAGDHQVFFISDEETLTLSHRALNREVFAKGALKAAFWLEDKKPGVYTMQDVLGI